MSFLGRVSQILRNLADGYQKSHEQKLLLKTYRSERQAKIARGEAPPSFRSYNEYLESEWWKRLRGHVLSQLADECEFCGSRATQVHHVRYPHIRDLGSESIKSLYAVCTHCHDIAHGFSANTSNATCAFCRSKATVTLTIAIRKHNVSSQRVCRRCDSLANGYRAQANKWMQKDYDVWVERWRETMPPLNQALSRTVVERQNLEEDRRHKSQFEERGRATAARRLVLEGWEREFAALSTEELRVRWDNREQLDYQDDELYLLRSVIRQRLGYQH